MCKFDNYLRQIGKNIKAARVKAGLAQIEVHERSGITYRHYQNIEAGKVNVSLETLFRLAKLYKTTVKELVGEAHSP
jgi:transcriptional regulator with XRE-family HTH domain